MGTGIPRSTVVFRNESTNAVTKISGRRPGALHLTGAACRQLHGRGLGSELRSRHEEGRCRGGGSSGAGGDDAERRIGDGPDHGRGEQLELGGGAVCSDGRPAGRTQRAYRGEHGVHPELQLAGRRLHRGDADDAGRLQHQLQRRGPGRREDVLPRLLRWPVRHHLRRHSVERHQLAIASLVGVLSVAVAGRRGLRSQPGYGIDGWADAVRRIGQPALEGDAGCA